MRAGTEAKAVCGFVLRETEKPPAGEGERFFKRENPGGGYFRSARRFITIPEKRTM